LFQPPFSDFCAQPTRPTRGGLRANASQGQRAVGAGLHGRHRPPQPTSSKLPRHCGDHLRERIQSAERFDDARHPILPLLLRAALGQPRRRLRGRSDARVKHSTGRAGAPPDTGESTGPGNYENVGKSQSALSL
jgi:hypothetical protein